MDATAGNPRQQSDDVNRNTGRMMLNTLTEYEWLSGLKKK